MLECEKCLCNTCDYSYCKKSICSLHKRNAEQKIIRLAFPIEKCEEYIDETLNFFIRLRMYIFNRFLRKENITDN